MLRNNLPITKNTAGISMVKLHLVRVLGIIFRIPKKNIIKETQTSTLATIVVIFTVLVKLIQVLNKPKQEKHTINVPAIKLQINQYKGVFSKNEEYARLSSKQLIIISIIDIREYSNTYKVIASTYKLNRLTVIALPNPK